MRRLLRWAAGLLVAALLAVAAWGVWTVRRSFPTTSGTVELDVLDRPVEVIRDDHGIPTIIASTTADLFRAQGYVHAQDRFFEMDFRRHVTAGRLAELFGADQVDTDRFIRVLGWRRVAEQELALLSEETLAVLEAYAQGVNAYIEDRDTAELSLEYAVLGLRRPGYEPEPWEPADSLAWLKAMAWDLRGNMQDEIARTLLAAEVGTARTEQLYPPYPYGRHQTIVRGGAIRAGSFDPAAEPAAATAAGLRDVRPALPAVRDQLAGLGRRVAALPGILGPATPGIGSNSWVVAGERTATGAPLLANDPHLGPAMPSIWYQAQLRCVPVSEACPYTAGGYTFAGVPGVIIGHTDRVAWGLTNLGPDVTDLVVEKVDGDRYESGGELVPMEVRTETVEVAGDDDVVLRVRETHHGPLISDESEEVAEVGAAAGRDLAGSPEGSGGRTDTEQRYGIALRWTALDPGRTADAITRLNRARGWDDFRAAAAVFEVPSQNLVYADVDGTIGYQVPGQIPIRTTGDGRWPVSGWTGEHEWSGYVPFDELPWVRDPDRGYVVTANERVVPPAYPHHLSQDTSYGYRGQRIVELLERAGRDLTVDDLTAMQLDTHNPNAAYLVPLLLAVDVDGDAAAAQALLEGWDLSQPPGSAAAAYFNAVWRHLLARTFHDEVPEDHQPSGEGRWFEVVRALAPDDPWWDDVTTAAVETRSDMLHAALVDAHTELSERLGEDPAAWEWGALHALDIENQSLGQSGLAPVRWLFNRGGFELGGGKSIVNATGWTASEGYEVDWVPSMRMVVDLADLDESRWINLTGASGHAFHGHYEDQAPLWAAGRTLPWRWSLAAVREAGVDVLTLRPAR